MDETSGGMQLTIAGRGGALV